jgi:hypothetical protein
VVVFLEDMKVRHLKVEDRKPLRLFDAQWPSRFAHVRRLPHHHHPLLPLFGCPSYTVRPAAAGSHCPHVACCVVCVSLYA